MTEPNVLELMDSDSDLAERALALYVAAFPVEERDPLDYILEDLCWRARGNHQAGQERHFLAAVDHGNLVGICMYGYYRDQRLAFLNYLATPPDLRGRGLGAWLLKHVLSRLAADAGLLGGLSPLGMCWEVERPQDAADLHEKALRERRIQFYRRNGALLLEDIQFTAPPLDEGLPPVAYHLMLLPVDPERVAIDLDLKRAAIQVSLLGAYGLDQGSSYYQQAIKSIRPGSNHP